MNQACSEKKTKLETRERNLRAHLLGVQLAYLRGSDRVQLHVDSNVVDCRLCGVGQLRRHGGAENINGHDADLIEQVYCVDVILKDEKFEELCARLDEYRLELARLPVGALVRVE